MTIRSQAHDHLERQLGPVRCFISELRLKGVGEGDTLVLKTASSLK